MAVSQELIHYEAHFGKEFKHARLGPSVRNLVWKLKTRGRATGGWGKNRKPEVDMWRIVNIRCLRRTRSQAPFFFFYMLTRDTRRSSVSERFRRERATTAVMWEIILQVHFSRFPVLLTVKSRKLMLSVHCWFLCLTNKQFALLFFSSNMLVSPEQRFIVSRQKKILKALPAVVVVALESDSSERFICC